MGDINLDDSFGDNASTNVDNDGFDIEQLESEEEDLLN